MFAKFIQFKIITSVKSSPDRPCFKWLGFKTGPGDYCDHLFPKEGSHNCMLEINGADPTVTGPAHPGCHTVRDVFDWTPVKTLKKREKLKPKKEANKLVRGLAMPIW